MSLEEFGTNINNINNKGVSTLIESKEMKAENFNPIRLCQWTEIESNTYLAVSSTKKKLPSGMYRIYRSDRGILFQKLDIEFDSLINFPDSIASNVLEEIETFWKSKKLFNQYGFIHKRGYLFYGPAGTGKSALVQQIAEQVILKDGIVILFDNLPRTVCDGLRLFRMLEPERKLVCVMEDIDALVVTYGEQELLSYLDGDDQISGVLNIATTNYPEKLDPRVVARPRRFDRLIKIGLPNENIRRAYLLHKLGNNNGNAKEIELMVEKTEGFTFAALADLVVSVKCLSIPLDDASSLLKNLLTKKASSIESKNVGFQYD